jgi:hypothetical protein
VSLVRKLQRVLLVLWAGSLWALGAWVSPTLFSMQGDRHLAGLLTGRLLLIETYLGAAVSLLALVLPGRGRFGWGYLAVALLGLNAWAPRPLMVEAHARGSVAGLSFGVWHGASALLYVITCIAMLLLIWNEDFR